MLKAKELKEQSAHELTDLLKAISRDLFNMNNELMLSRKIDKPHLLREKKRDRAKVLTVLRQKEKG
jgi:large subunit ribosomal protein L29